MPQFTSGTKRYLLVLAVTLVAARRRQPRHLLDFDLCGLGIELRGDVLDVRGPGNAPHCSAAYGLRREHSLRRRRPWRHRSFCLALVSHLTLLGDSARAYLTKVGCDLLGLLGTQRNRTDASKKDLFRDPIAQSRQKPLMVPFRESSARMRGQPSNYLICTHPSASQRRQLVPDTIISLFASQKNIRQLITSQRQPRSPWRARARPAARVAKLPYAAVVPPRLANVDRHLTASSAPMPHQQHTRSTVALSVTKRETLFSVYALGASHCRAMLVSSCRSAARPSLARRLGPTRGFGEDPCVEPISCYRPHTRQGRYVREPALRRV